MIDLKLAVFMRPKLLNRDVLQPINALQLVFEDNKLSYRREIGEAIDIFKLVIREAKISYSLDL